MTGSLVSMIGALGLASALSWAVKASVILGAGAIAARLGRHASASVRFLLLAGTFTGLLALPGLMTFAPSIAVPLPASLAMPAAPPAPSSTRHVAAREPGQAAPDVADAAAAAAEGAVSPRAIGAAVRTTWLLVAVWLTAVLAWSVWRLGRLARAGIPWRDAEPLVDELARSAGLRRSVHIVRHEAVAAPFTCGVRRPTIVLPWDACEWSDADVRRALVHEIEHVRRGDWPVLLVARLTCAVYWFHPMAWRALRALGLEAERACDDAVLASSASEDYADQLVALAGRVRETAALPVLAMAGRSDLSVRVRALLDGGQRRGRAGWQAIVVTIAVALVGGAALGAVRATAAETIINRGAGDAALHANQPPRGVGAAERETESEDEDDEESSAGYALYRAASRGNVRLMTALIDGGADVNAALGGDGSPLIGAARNGRLPAVQLLLERGADANMGVGGDGNPLIAAAARGHLSVARLLLDRGARVDDVVDGDENPLIQASANGHLEMAKLLVSHGADVNARVWAERYDGRGEWRSPLSQARRAGHTPVVAFLESSGARE